MYQVGDFVIRLKNSCMARRRTVVFPYSKMNKAIASVLTKEGFLLSFEEAQADGKKEIIGNIRYERRKPVFVDVAIVSKPSLRIYEKGRNLQGKKRRAQGIEVVSTSLGVMTGSDAKRKGIGGELLFRIW